MMNHLNIWAGISTMSNDKHKENLLDNTKDLLAAIDVLPIHPRNKLLIYHRYLLSKLSWDLTVADISITWVKQSLDSIVNQQVRFWLEIPISGTLDIIQLSKGKYDIGFLPVSTRFAQCQNTLRNCMKNSPNSDINKIYEVTHTATNLQYDQFKSTKEVIKSKRSEKEIRVTEKLTTQSLVVTSIWEQAMKSSNII